jgi:hypothetical protein
MELLAMITRTKSDQGRTRQTVETCARTRHRLVEGVGAVESALLAAFRHALALLEARSVAAFFAAMGVLPFDIASAAGGAIARLIGPRLAVTRRALRNLDLALPHLSDAKRRRVIREMWNNLGRIAAEYPHLSRLRCFAPGTRVEVVGMQHIDRAVARGRPLIFFSGHFGNWEVACVAIRQYGLELAQVYRGQQPRPRGDHAATAPIAGGRTYSQGRGRCPAHHRRAATGEEPGAAGRSKNERRHRCAVFRPRSDDGAGHRGASLALRLLGAADARRPTARGALPLHDFSGTRFRAVKRSSRRCSRGDDRGQPPARAVDPRAARAMVLASSSLAGIVCEISTSGGVRGD